jgi:hypothetical protein
MYPGVLKLSTLIPAQICPKIELRGNWREVGSLVLASANIPTEGKWGNLIV